MSTDNAVKKAHPIAFSFIILFSFIEFLITTILISNYNSDNSYYSDSLRDRLKFLLFTSIWSLVFTSIYLFGIFKLPTNFLFSLASHAGFLFITWIFWLSGAAALSDTLSGLSCGDLFLSDVRINVGIRYCHSLKAVQAFAWIEWITLSFVLAYIALIASRAVKAGTGLKSPMREVPAAV
ncbi:uncharacterized protein MELLADRAFT_113979 [Melampsora larici-populina 98AG31]|uniref:MARVEL domain-containing protein n=1 Tax=Melampsora larici-populina (strain 98AG31 / pathotype 3-4-7) TaxID=747676 RepID=F4SBQ8_MELLP|nr:uncharacterized protein MELLADRAFT_113979 [Melampsora larici-populina 98AG31]EGF97909.1 hypothetical protein MELLADRAFT_113979 [Melampsora larici-populina 98AG31]